MEDDEMLQRVLREMMLPKLLNEDMIVFEMIMQDLFPEQKKIERKNSELTKFIIEAAKE